jgi:ribosome-associated heat shock protein Hsp15
MAKRAREHGTTTDADQTGTRLDLWLWAARYFKTRSLAAQAITGGKISLNEERPKPSRVVRVGDRLRIQLGPYEHLVTVMGVARRRGPASEAATLMAEDPASVTRRAELSALLKAEARIFASHDGRPTKKERRQIGKLRGRD